MDDIEKRRRDRWNFLFIAGMWFQDLFNYDFRRTEQCIIPYATQEGEISFCAYNTGVGWRNIIEKMHMTATLTKWYDEHGRHEIFAGGKKVGLDRPRPQAGAQQADVDSGVSTISTDSASPRPRAKRRSVPATRSSRRSRKPKTARWRSCTASTCSARRSRKAGSCRSAPLAPSLPAPKKEEREEVGSFGD